MFLPGNLNVYGNVSNHIVRGNADLFVHCLPFLMCAPDVR